MIEAGSPLRTCEDDNIIWIEYHCELAVNEILLYFMEVQERPGTLFN